MATSIRVESSRLLDIGHDHVDLQGADEAELLIDCEEDRTLGAALIKGWRMPLDGTTRAESYSVCPS
jgi:hypothetical protein